MKLRRLFWKLFLAFWLATITAFLLGFVVLEFSNVDPPKGQPSRLVPLIAGAVASLFFSAALAWYLARPLSHLSRAFRAAGEGQLGTRIKPLMGRRRDEIADLAGEFDRMASQLEHLLQSQQRLLHDISHELRSPLTRLQVAIGLLHQAPEQTTEMIARVGREAERLDTLIEELLTLSRLDAAAPELPRARVDLMELLAAIAEDASFEAEARGCSVQLEGGGSYVDEVSAEMLYRAFENVIRNAIKFTASNTTVRIRADPGPDALRVMVLDCGPGVADEMLTEIFEPFKRGENDPERAPGFGLGLAIAKRAIELHGGSISAHGSVGRGLCIDMRLPRQV